MARRLGFRRIVGALDTGLEPGLLGGAEAMASLGPKSFAAAELDWLALVFMSLRLGSNCSNDLNPSIPVLEVSREQSILVIPLINRTLINRRLINRTLISGCR